MQRMSFEYFNFKKIFFTVLTIIVSVTAFSCYNVKAADTAVFAAVSKSTVILDGKMIVFNAYTIESVQYFKLRDVAYTLNTTKKQFEVSWDSKNETIKLVSGKPYQPTGLEMTVNENDNMKAQKVQIKIECDNELFELPAYLIDNNYCLELLKIAKILNVSTDLNGEQYIINTHRYWGEKSAILTETVDMGQDYLDSIIFIGDSTTYGLQAYGVLTNGTMSTQVWVPANKTFSLFNQKNITIQYPETGEKISVEKAVELKKPPYIIITLGANGVSSMSKDNFKSHYKELIDRIIYADSNVKIILNSIYPVARNYKFLDSINNNKINSANNWIIEIAEEMNLRYLDTNSILKDDEGWLMAKYQSGDGLHLTSAAYKLILEYLKTHGYQ